MADLIPVFMSSGIATFHNDGGKAIGWSVRSHDGNNHASTDSREDAIRILSGWYLIDLMTRNEH